MGMCRLTYYHYHSKQYFDWRQTSVSVNSAKSTCSAHPEKTEGSNGCGCPVSGLAFLF